MTTFAKGRHVRLLPLPAHHAIAPIDDEETDETELDTDPPMMCPETFSYCDDPHCAAHGCKLRLPGERSRLPAGDERYAP